MANCESKELSPLRLELELRIGILERAVATVIPLLIEAHNRAPNESERLELRAAVEQCGEAISGVARRAL